MSRVATLTHARDEAQFRAAALARRLAELDAGAAPSGDAREGLSSLVAQLADEEAARYEPGGGGGPPALEQLRAEAVRGRERAAQIERHARSLLESVGGSG